MIGALAVILAQTCSSVLPKPNLEVEWLRNGRTWARDVPIEATTLTRTYKRTRQGTAGSVVRTLSCSNGTGGVVLTETIRQNASIDWTIKESVKAKLKVAVKRILRKYGYPPDMQMLATETVLKQAEMIANEITT